MCVFTYLCFDRMYSYGVMIHGQTGYKFYPLYSVNQNTESTWKKFVRKVLQLITHVLLGFSQ